MFVEYIFAICAIIGGAVVIGLIVGGFIRTCFWIDDKITEKKKNAREEKAKKDLHTLSVIDPLFDFYYYLKKVLESCTNKEHIDVVRCWAAAYFDRMESDFIKRGCEKISAEMYVGDIRARFNDDIINHLWKLVDGFIERIRNNDE